MKREGLSTITEELKGLPKLRTVEKYFKQRFETEILNKIVGQMHTRAAASISELDPEVQTMI
jgi:hypothetical protein